MHISCDQRMDDWTSINMFGKLKLPWLRQYLPYARGIPSHDVLGKVFAVLDPVQFSTCFRDWVNSMAALTGGEVIAIDGKTICGSDDKGSGKSACMWCQRMLRETGSVLDKRRLLKKVTRSQRSPLCLNCLPLKIAL
jgi:hypothetical protein